MFQRCFLLWKYRAATSNSYPFFLGYWSPQSSSFKLARPSFELLANSFIFSVALRLYFRYRFVSNKEIYVGCDFALSSVSVFVMVAILRIQRCVFFYIYIVQIIVYCCKALYLECWMGKSIHTYICMPKMIVGSIPKTAFCQNTITAVRSKQNLCKYKQLYREDFFHSQSRISTLPIYAEVPN